MELNRIQTIQLPNRRIWTVKLDKKVVGQIVHGKDGYRYSPKGHAGIKGEPFPSLGACIDSLKD
jgi:hypothetical protein